MEWVLCVQWLRLAVTGLGSGLQSLHSLCQLHTNGLLHDFEGTFGLHSLHYLYYWLSGHQMGFKIASNVFFSSGSGLTADSSVLTLTLAFLDFGLDFAQSFPFHAQFCHFGLKIFNLGIKGRLGYHDVGKTPVFDLRVMEPLCFVWPYRIKEFFIGMITKFIKFIELKFPVFTRNYKDRSLLALGPVGFKFCAGKAHSESSSLSRPGGHGFSPMVLSRISFQGHDVILHCPLVMWVISGVERRGSNKSGPKREFQKFAKLLGHHWWGVALLKPILDNNSRLPRELLVPLVKTGTGTIKSYAPLSKISQTGWRFEHLITL
ncbi:hypothetical protein Tco_0550444 [Tanacetum coccineum]